MSLLFCKNMKNRVALFQILQIMEYRNQEINILVIKSDFGPFILNSNDIGSNALLIST